jgi:hypothetical protein
MIQLAHRIVLTEDCNRACPHCFNADQRNGKHMDTDKLFDFWTVNRLALKGAELKIMGGEPTIHPDFLNVASTGIFLFDKISVFTNGTNLNYITHPDIMAAHWGDKFQFIINGFTLPYDNWEAWGRYYKKAQFHFVLGEKIAIDRIRYLAKTVPPIQSHFILSGNTQINIFDDKYRDEYRTRYVESLCEIIPKLRDYGHTFGYDHTFPQCFWTQEMLDKLHLKYITPPYLGRSRCCDTIIGLLDTNFDLWYCNQTHIKIGNMFVNGKPRKMEEITRMLRDMPGKKCAEMCRTQCTECSAKTACKSACWFKHVS